MRDPSNIIGILIGIIWLIAKVAPALRDASKQSASTKARPKRSMPAAADLKPPMGRPLPAVPFGAPRAPDLQEERRRKMLARLEKLERRAEKLAGAVQRDRATQRFADTLTGFVPGELARARAALATGAPLAWAGEAEDGIEIVLEEIKLLVKQRRDPALLPELGDADAFADACYAPVIAFARAEGLPLRSGYPATQLTDFDLAIWTGFLPTSIAPIFLPADFFSSALRWPALAHEIGHDFLASIDGLEPALRGELGLPSVEIGAQPLSLENNEFERSELVRVFGAWFEEIFCDVFGTLMCGPAYVITMSAHFAAEDDPDEILAVQTDATRILYDSHPPSHLRVMVGCMVLERGGFHTEARELQHAWVVRHAGAELDHLLFPTGASWLWLPLLPFLQIAGALVERLYIGPLKALSGFGLQDVSGVDYGPHEHQEALRAREALLTGRVPPARDVRAVIAGAVLAAQRRPELEAQILKNARAAIQAVGTSERRLDAYAATPEEGGGASWVDRRAVVEALVLREILLPPRSLRGRRRARL